LFYGGGAITGEIMLSALGMPRFSSALRDVSVLEGFASTISPFDKGKDCFFIAMIQPNPHI
jgi:hypothetical protein